VTASLDPAGTYGAALVNDLRARAWAGLGEVHRRTSDLRGAGEAFANAESWIVQGTGDALEEAQILELKAALVRDQDRAAEAHRLLDEVIAVYRRYRDFHLLGRAFIQKGRVHGRGNELEAAIEWLRKGLGLIDAEGERCLALSARHSLMLYLTESGRLREARFLLKASRPDFLRHGSPLLILRLRWLEGKIYDALGFVAEAERALLDARRGFAGLGIGFSAAAVSLDLAGLYAAQGRAAEMRSLAEDILPIFRSRDLHREAIAALIALQQASRMETLSAKLRAEVRAGLDHVRRDPKLRFDPF
jgi:tetratricopeptide (TPR) repeat protein